MNNPLVFALLSGLLFGTWPLVMKKAGLTPMAAATTLTVMTLAVCAPFLNRADYRTTSVFTLGFGLAVVAGLMNGAGTIAFQKVIVAKNLEITTGILIVILTQVAITAVGGRVVYGDPLTIKKAFGLVAAVVATYLLTAK